MLQLQSFSDIKYARYINLNERSDRRSHMESQLKAIGLSDICKRFPAISMPNGAIGCSMSHLKILQIAHEQKWPHILVMEDDIDFLNPNAFLTQARHAFAHVGDEWDVILLAGNVFNGYVSIAESLIQVKTCQTTTGYLVNGPYIETLMHNIKQGLLQLIQQPTNKCQYAIDRYWFRLQAVHRWYMIVPLQVTQCAGYSNIERTNTNYSNIMLNIDKRTR